MNANKSRQFARMGRGKGTILIVTIWVVLVLAGLALVFARSMRIAAIVSANHVASLKAESVAAGASEFIMAKLAAGEQESGDLMESEPYEAVELGEDYFWVLRSNLEDDDELDFPFNGPVQFDGMEEPTWLRCNPRALREGYLAAMGTYLEEVRRGCVRHNVDYSLLRTSQPLDAALAAYLSNRLGMHHKN